MGFFSKIKNIWSGKTEPSQAQTQPRSEQEPAQAYPQAMEIPGEAEAQRPQVSERTEEAWQIELRRMLQQAEPRLSAWLDLVLADVSRADQTLWDRLGFLLECLEVPQSEAEDFLKRFRDWLEDMDYERVEEFRSELQYRLALALDLEDEEDEQSRLFLKLSKGLNKTKEQLSKRIDTLIASSSQFDDAFWEELEEILIMADVGFTTTTSLVENLRNKVRERKIQDPESFKQAFREELGAMFPDRPKRIKPEPPEVVLMVGVNGVGKTTTIAKLAHRAQMQGHTVLIAAADTFRAAAIEQLQIWAERVGAGFYAKQAKSDPAAVAYEAVKHAVENGYDTIYVDTAGRLHTKVDLMDELKKIKRVLHKVHPGAPHRTMLVVDGTTGQNAISQTKLFNEGVGVDEIVLTKLDGTAKGGVVLSIAVEQSLPITYVGLGEKMEDLRPFNGQDFAQALLD